MKFSVALFCLALFTGADVEKENRDIYKNPKPEDVSVFQHMLSNEDSGLRAQAASALARLGPEGKEALPELIAALGDSKNSTRFFVIKALGAIGPSAAEAVPALVPMLDEKDLRLDTIETLRRIGPGAAPALPKLMQLVHHPDNSVKLPAGRAIEFIGPAALPMLMKEIEKPNDQIEPVAILSLAAMGKGTEPAVPRLVELLPDPKIGEFSQRALTRIGKIATPALVENLSSENEAIRGRSLAALKEIGTPAAEALVVASNDPKRQNFVAYILGMGEFEKVPSVFLPGLLAVLNNDGQEEQYYALRAIQKIGPAANGASADITKKFNAEHPFVRLSAAGALAVVDPKQTKKAIEVIEKDSRHEHRDVRLYAIDNIRLLPVNTRIPLLIPLLSDPSKIVRESALSSIADMGPAATAAIPALEKLKAENSNAAAFVDHAIDRIRRSAARKKRSN